MISTFEIKGVPTLKEKKNFLQEETFGSTSQVEKGFVKSSKAQKDSEHRLCQFRCCTWLGGAIPWSASQSGFQCTEPLLPLGKEW